jgi:hypothetical protein
MARASVTAAICVRLTAQRVASAEEECLPVGVTSEIPVEDGPDVLAIYLVLGPRWPRPHLHLPEGELGGPRPFESHASTA